MTLGEMQEQLLAQESELDSREGTIIAQEDGMRFLSTPLG
jgi:hypothetical protein